MYKNKQSTQTHVQREELDLSATNVCRKVLAKVYASVTKELEQGNNAADEDGIRAGPSEHSLLSKLLSTIPLMVLSVSELAQYFITFTTQSLIQLNLALERKQDSHGVKAFFGCESIVIHEQNRGPDRYRSIALQLDDPSYKTPQSLVNLQTVSFGVPLQSFIEKCGAFSSSAKVLHESTLANAREYPMTSKEKRCKSND